MANNTTCPNTNELLNEALPIVEVDGRKYYKLNEMQDVTIDNVTYHISSRFLDGHTLSELLDLVTLEKIERAAAETCFKA